MLCSCHTKRPSTTAAQCVPNESIQSSIKLLSSVQSSKGLYRQISAALMHWVDGVSVLGQTEHQRPKVSLNKASIANNHCIYIPCPFVGRVPLKYAHGMPTHGASQGAGDNSPPRSSGTVTSHARGHQTGQKLDPGSPCAKREDRQSCEVPHFRNLLRCLPDLLVLPSSTVPFATPSANSMFIPDGHLGTHNQIESCACPPLPRSLAAWTPNLQADTERV